MVVAMRIQKETTGIIEGAVTGQFYVEGTVDTTTIVLIATNDAFDSALRGEDYPALVRVWDNDVDAAIYDTD